jgi:hypothetical protein
MAGEALSSNLQRPTTNLHRGARPTVQAPPADVRSNFCPRHSGDRSLRNSCQLSNATSGRMRRAGVSLFIMAHNGRASAANLDHRSSMSRPSLTRRQKSRTRPRCGGEGGMPEGAAGLIASHTRHWGGWLVQRSQATHRDVGRGTGRHVAATTPKSYAYPMPDLARFRAKHDFPDSQPTPLHSVKETTASHSTSSMRSI